MKLKITDEKLDEFMQIDFVSSGRVPTEWAVMNYKSGFQATESFHQSKVDKLTEIISKMKDALKYYSLKSNYSIIDEGRNYSTELVCYELDDYYSDTELGTKAKQTLAETDKMLKELNEQENNLHA